MKWQIGDRFQNRKKPEVLYIVLGVSENSYLLITKPMSIRTILSHSDIEGPDWIKYEGEQYVKNTVPNNGKSSKKKRRNETGRPLPKRSVNPTGGNKPSGTPTGSSINTPGSGKPPTRKWWKRKKKGLRRKVGKPNPNKGL
jgi:hypothetical protein